MQNTSAMKQESPSGLTPMMQQYWDTKQTVPDCLLFYRMGDFYELFFDDAVKASAALSIALTKRGKANGDDIQMCGVPFHAYEGYLAKLIKAGFKVAIAEQTETPEQAKARGGHKALVKREIVRIVTQGTLTEDHLLDTGSNNYLACVCSASENHFSLAWLDLSTGQFHAQSLKSLPSLLAALERLSAGEILISDKLDTSILSDYRRLLTVEPDSLFNAGNAEKALHDMYEVQSMDAFGHFDKPLKTACGSLINYARKTQQGVLPFIKPPKVIEANGLMHIDAATMRNLEILRCMNGEKKGSLLDTLDKCVTASGSRLLAERLSAPLANKNAIDARLSEVSAFANNSHLCDDVRNILKETPDIERALSRLTVGRGGPRDLQMILRGVEQSFLLRHVLDQDKLPPLQHFNDSLTDNPDLSHFIDDLKSALADDLPMLTRDGGFIKRGFHAGLDELRDIRKNSQKHMADLQSQYVQKTGINSLKITHNNVLGYFIEVPSKQADKLMVGNQEASNDNPFVHRQTMASAVRFTTAALAELESKLSQSQERSKAIEIEIFEQLAQTLITLAPQIAERAHIIAQLDVASALAELATQENFCAPTISENKDFDIKKGRHPVVEQALRKDKQGESFISNDCALESGQSLWILTGPNMAGKSTFLRQNAIIALMAQAGSYVPAESATIGLVDRLFSRVGAADDLARGRSTFMVEMVETAAILNQATERSLVILDEIGRGTATFDGLSIAWATLEYLHDKTDCRGLFATHYHELTTLTDTLSNLSCHSMQVKEWQNEIIFMHSVAKGAADKSYGIHVGKLAGLPAAVITRSEQILGELQKSESHGKLSTLAQDLPLFQEVSQQAEQSAETAKYEDMYKKVQDIDPDSLSPREALEALYALKQNTN